ncbi:hypothetical protein PN462_03640 [Spirulina sp. CS-785/01]|uniref:hypothetical protein n=1 Tax=Spirulina sp. CS-785/01 TaxID=3021716 RepID=UPI00232B24A4|nr:hypothetical protein [Spirulina sp. CS-785/01]MDB9312183.1 hypothetical protein [Spirulina sp. CS-785/01]
MMLAPLVVSLSVASVAVFLNINAKEEIIKVSAAVIAVISLFLSIFFAPLVIKLLIAAIPLVTDKLNFIKIFN